MIEIGRMNTFTVFEKIKDGYHLRAGDLDINVFLSQKDCPNELDLNSTLEAFVYIDNKDEPIATLQRPSALVGEFAVMKVLETHQFGAFVDWGISKDLLIPDTEQKDRVGLGQYYIVKVGIDERTNKLYGTTKIGKYIQDFEFDINVGEQVSVIPAREEGLGYRCLINQKFVGMIYYNEIFQKIKIGEEIKGFVKKIRDDKLVDIALQVQGFKNIVNSKDKILAYLEENGGKSYLHDKSNPEEIKRILNMSKKTFKNTIGMLYKDKKILIEKDGIKLVK